MAFVLGKATQWDCTAPWYLQGAAPSPLSGFRAPMWIKKALGQCCVPTLHAARSHIPGWLEAAPKLVLLLYNRTNRATFHNILMRNTEECPGDVDNISVPWHREKIKGVCYLKWRSLLLSEVGRHFHSACSWKCSDVIGGAIQEHCLFSDTPIKTETEARKYSKP